MGDGKKDAKAPIYLKILEIITRIVADDLSPTEYAPRLDEIAALQSKLLGTDSDTYPKLFRADREAMRAYVEARLQRRRSFVRDFPPLPNKPYGPKRPTYRDFIEHLLNRQGSILPDFDSLYDRKADLDDKLFGHAPPSQES